MVGVVLEEDEAVVGVGEWLASHAGGSNEYHIGPTDKFFKTFYII